MTLHPCPTCRRHVAVVDVEVACPFCGASVAARPREPVLAARLCRAAVFASATLTACYVDSRPAPQYQPPPPPPDQQGDTNYSDPPPPPPDVQRRGGLHIVVTDGRQTFDGISVTVTGNGTSVSGVTNANGVAIFRNLMPGNYTVQIPSNHPRHAPTTARAVIRSGDTTRVDLVHQPYVPPPHDQHHQPMPYGAPPARSRIV